jgi:tetratricopeptide (TPR) repeat protein
MRIRKVIVGAFAAALVGVVGWLGWRWYTTPVLPAIAFDRSDPALSKLVEDAEAEVRRHPRSGKAWGKLGMILAANYLPLPAVECFVHAARFDPGNPRWHYLHGDRLLQGRPRDAISSLRLALAHAEVPSHRSIVLFRLAQALIEEGELGEAEKNIAELNSIEPGSPQVQLCYGVLAIARQDNAAARKCLGRLLENPFARKTVRRLLAPLVSDDRELALRYQKEAAQLPPDLAWPDPFLAEMARNRASRTCRLQDVADMLHRGDGAEAKEACQRLIEESPTAESYFLLVNALTLLHQLDEAEQVVQTIIGLEPNNGTAHAMLGQLFYQKGVKDWNQPTAKETARAWFRRAVAAEDLALSLQGEHARAHLTRGQSLIYLGQTDEGLQALRQAVATRPEVAAMHLALGEALAEAGQVREGVNHLENAVRLADPNDARTRAALAKWRAALPSSHRPPTNPK